LGPCGPLRALCRGTWVVGFELRGSRPSSYVPRCLRASASPITLQRYDIPEGHFRIPSRSFPLFPILSNTLLIGGKVDPLLSRRKISQKIWNFQIFFISLHRETKKWRTVLWEQTPNLSIQSKCITNKGKYFS
jgi:hypothetical protein